MNSIKLSQWEYRFHFASRLYSPQQCTTYVNSPVL